MKSEITRRMISGTVSTAEQEISLSEEIMLEGVEINLVGIRVSGSDAAAIYSNSVFRKFEINSEEILSPDYPAKIFLCSMCSPPSQRFYRMNLNCGSNPKFEIVYKDGGWENASYPYVVSIYLHFEVWKLG